jgi:hypothetical protein
MEAFAWERRMSALDTSPSSDACAPRARRTRQKPRLENTIQREIIAYLAAVLVPSEAFAYANANASRRTAGGKASNAVPGLYSGIPDLTIIARNGVAFYLEVKNEVGTLRPEQEGVIERFIRMNVPYAVVRSIGDVKTALAQWKIKVREVSL